MDLNDIYPKQTPLTPEEEKRKAIIEQVAHESIPLDEDDYDMQPLYPQEPSGRPITPLTMQSKADRERDNKIRAERAAQWQDFIRDSLKDENNDPSEYPMDERTKRQLQQWRIDPIEGLPHGWDLIRFPGENRGVVVNPRKAVCASYDCVKGEYRIGNDLYHDDTIKLNRHGESKAIAVVLDHTRSKYRHYNSAKAAQKSAPEPEKAPEAKKQPEKQKPKYRGR